MKKHLVLLASIMAAHTINAARPLEKQCKTVQKQLSTIKRELDAFAKKAPPYEVSNLISLIRTHISLMASGTTAAAPRYASQELDIKKHLDAPTKKLFSKIRDNAHALNPPAALLGGATISFEAETYLAGVIALLREQLPTPDKKKKSLLATPPKTDKQLIKKLHKQGIRNVKKQAKKLSEQDKKLIGADSGLIDTYKELHHAKAQKASIGPHASHELTQKVHRAANREIELFMHLSNEAKTLFRAIRDYAQKIGAQDTFAGGLSPKVRQFLDAAKKRLQ